MNRELRLGGAVSLHDGRGNVHHLPSARAQIALARLTIQRATGTTRHQLAETLWPNELPSAWESALRSVVSRVRAFVATAMPPGSNPVSVRSGHYVLSLPDDLVVDIEDGERALAQARQALANRSYGEARLLAATAVTRLGAPLLVGHDGDWINRARDRYADLHLDALETASVAALALDEHGDALRLANEAAGLAPMRESAHRCGINAHVAAGNRAAALHLYHELRKMLADEFGVDPSPETEDAYLALLGEVAGARRSPGERAIRRRAAEFVGRPRELATLAESWSRALNHDSHVVLITGETGIGKTRLLTETARRITAEGGRALCVRCDGSMTTAFAPFAEIIDGYLAAKPDDLLPNLSETTRHLLAQVRSPGGAPLSERLSFAALRAACTEVLDAAAAEQPLLLVLDDIHLADDTTLWLLRHVVHVCAAARLMIIATARSDGPRPPAFYHVMDDLERDGCLQRIELTGLEPGETLKLLRHEMRDSTASRRQPVQRMILDTAGNPFLLLELIRQCGDTAAADLAPATPPVAVREYTRARLSVLGQAEHDLLNAAAVSGDEFELDVVAEVAGLGTAAAHSALKQLRDVGLITEAGFGDPEPGVSVRHRFVHAVIQRVVYEQLGEAHRRTLHHRCADAIEALYGGGLDEHMVRLTHHRFAAGSALGRQALTWACRAANQIHRSGAPREASRLYTDALDVVPEDEHEQRAEILAKLGHAQHDTGHRDAGHTLLAATIAARRSDRPDIAVDAALTLAAVAERDHRFRDEATTLLDEMLAAHSADARHDGANGRRARRLDPLIVAHVAVRRIRLGGTVAPAITALAVRALAGELAELGGVAAIERRSALARELNDLAVAAGDDRGRLVAAHHLAMVAEITTDRPEVTGAALGTILAMRNTDPRIVEALLAERNVATAITEGRVLDAIDVAWPVAPPGKDDDNVPLGGAPPGSVVAHQLLVARCLQHALGRTLAVPVVGAPTTMVERSLVDLFSGERGRASLTVRSLVTGAEPMPTGDEWLHAVGLLGFAAVELGDPMIADALREMLTPVAHLTSCVGYRSFVAPVAFHLGRLDAMLGDWGEAERHLTVALRVLGRRRAHPWIIIAEHALARTLRARNERVPRRSAGELDGAATF
jgi:DNA-binding SARP family transcriptional activator